VLDKIFVPFFTTKTRGSGLGLPTAKRLIEAHRGHIKIACPPQGMPLESCSPLNDIPLLTRALAFDRR
jgi:nitrogen-specific signal transduction histidine kinase